LQPNRSVNPTRMALDNFCRVSRSGALPRKVKNKGSSVQSAPVQSETTGPAADMTSKGSRASTCIRMFTHTLIASCTIFAITAHAQTGDPAAGRTKAATCAACHGADGNSVTPEWPSLAGQSEAYIVRQLEAYRDRQRPDVGMQQFAMTVSEQDMHDIGAYYASQTLLPKGADPEHVELGESIYRGGVPERGIAACIACHGPGGHGNPLAAYPRINGQHASYLQKTLREYQNGERSSDADKNQMMRNVAELLLEDEIVALSSYIQGLQ
jgi:cytochrome c553